MQIFIIAFSAMQGFWDIAPDEAHFSVKNYWYFSCFSTKTYYACPLEVLLQGVSKIKRNIYVDIVLFCSYAKMSTWSNVSVS